MIQHDLALPPDFHDDTRRAGGFRLYESLALDTWHRVEKIDHANARVRQAVQASLDHKQTHCYIPQSVALLIHWVT